MSDAGNIPAGMLPRLMQLGAVLNRNRLAERAMEHSGISLDRPAMSVLAVLHAADEPLRIGEIAHRMQVVGPHVTRQLHELERRGMARRVADPDDQRARRVELTTAGRAAVGKYLKTLFGWFDEAIAGWPERDRRTFAVLLGRFVDDLTTHQESLDTD